MAVPQQPSNHTKILIVASPGWFQESLRVLIASITRGEAIELAHDVNSVLHGTINDPPRLVLIALDSIKETQAALIAIKEVWPLTRTVLLVDHDIDIKAVQGYEADAVLLKGTLAASLIHSIQDLLL